MQEITVYGKDDEILTYLTQWDKNVVIKLKDNIPPNAAHVHFFNCNSKEAMVMTATYENGTLSTQVPNDLLTEPHAIIGYIWVDECLPDFKKKDRTDPYDKSYEHKSIYGFRLMVRNCPRPSNQVYEDQKEFITFEKILLEANGYSLFSKSYAVGGTDFRDDEDTNNAKYYSEQAQHHAQAASRSERFASDFSDSAAAFSDNAAAFSDNATRQASAASKSAYSAAEKAGESATSAIEAESFAHGGTETRTNEETDNAKYYCEQSHNNSNISKEYLKKVEEAGNEAVAAVKNALDMDKPSFQVDLSTGNLMYEGGKFMFQVNKAGYLEWRLTV